MVRNQEWLDVTAMVSRPAVDGHAGGVRDDLTDLLRLDEEVARLGDDRDIPPDEGLHLAAVVSHRLMALLANLDARGISRDTLVESLRHTRRVHAASPFVARLQRWPRGYAGDFETVEALVQQQNQAPPATFAYYIEQFALASPIAQQHRNKVDIQAQTILDAVTARYDHVPSILVLAAGGSPDLRRIEGQLAQHVFEATLVDQDEGALQFSDAQLPRVRHRLRFIHADVVRGLRRAAAGGSFDLIVAGGLFDYLPTPLAVRLLKAARLALRPGGRLLFTNIALGNPYRPWIEHLADWILIHRSPEQVVGLARTAGFPSAGIDVARDRTGLALVVSATDGPGTVGLGAPN